MTLRLPTRALAPVLVLAILSGIVASFMVYRTMPSGSESSLSPTPRLNRKPVHKPAAAKKTAPAKAKVTVRAKAKAKTNTAAKPKARRVAVPTQPPARRPVETPKGDPVNAHGLPLVLARALHKHPVTVVALYDPQAAIDEMALAEARAGAASVNAGFLALNIRNEPQVRPLAQLLGVLESPSILVYERPHTLFVRMDGFSDRQTVAQAAVNARR